LLLALTAAAVVFVIDDLFQNRTLPLHVRAPLDEVGHAATMVVLLCALVGRVPRAFVTGGLLGAVMLDLDHLSIVLHLHAWAPADGRPFTHSLATVVVVALLSCLTRRWRMFGIGVACGLLTHLLRDLADGVVPLFWPVTTAQLSIPYPLYAATILVTLGWLVLREMSFVLPGWKTGGYQE
jgi:inner membrane protein